MTAASLTYTQAYQGDLREVFRNPLALVLAIIGTLLTCAAMMMLAFVLSEDCVANFEQGWVAQGRELYSDEFKASVIADCDDELEDVECIKKKRYEWEADERSPYSLEYNLAVSEACPAETKDEDEFEIDFEPGALTRLGEEILEEIEKVIVQETRPEEETVAETVTEDEEAQPKEEEEPEPDEEPTKTDKPPPPDKKDKKLPTSKLPTKKNTPYDDLPTVKVPKGDPFGDPDGWSDLKKEGDPWATAVMKALNNMPVGAFAAKGKKGQFKFRLVLCKDGSIKNVEDKGGNLPPDAVAGVKLALNQLKLPKPPPKVASKMKSNCAKIKYVFRWSGRGVK